MIIASSSSGLTMSEIQVGLPHLHPERCVIGHPFNPPHLVPLVEIVGGAKTSEATIQRAAEFYTSLGKQTVRLRKEVPGHVANRLQAALAREVYYLVADGVVSAADVDTALCWGPGLRWGIMGNMMLNHLGGGPGGIEHFFEQFTGPMTAWWKVLGSPDTDSRSAKEAHRQRLMPRSDRARSPSWRRSATRSCWDCSSCAANLRARLLSRPSQPAPASGQI